jgi:hypothetical protein
MSNAARRDAPPESRSLLSGDRPLVAAGREADTQNMHIRALPVCLLLSLFASQADAQFSVPEPAAGENFNVELGLMYWKPAPRLVIGSNSLQTVSATGVDFVQEFDIQDKRFREFRAVIRAGKTKLRASHVKMVYNEAAVLQRAIIVGGRTFNVAANATADLEWDLWRLGYERDLVKSDRALLGFIAEVNFNHVVANLNATAAGITATSFTDEKVPFPALGAIARVYPHKNVGITVEWTGFKMPGFLANKLTDTENGAAHMKDLDIYVTGSITRYFGIQGGYRALSADYLLDADSGDFEMKGPYFGAMIRF